MAFAWGRGWPTAVPNEVVELEQRSLLLEEEPREEILVPALQHLHRPRRFLLELRRGNASHTRPLRRRQHRGLLRCCGHGGAPDLGPAGTANVGGDVHSVGHIQHHHVKAAAEGRQDLLQTSSEAKAACRAQRQQDPAAVAAPAPSGRGRTASAVPLKTSMSSSALKRAGAMAPLRNQNACVAVSHRARCACCWRPQQHVPRYCSVTRNTW